MEDQHLAIAIRTRANADRGRLNFGCDHSRDFARNALKIDTSDAGTIERDRIAHKLLDGIQSLALDFITPHYIHRLRSKPDVSGNRNLSVDHPPNHIGALLAAFHLDRLRSAFFHKP